jgi:replicative DNA helicase Mcm
MLSEEADIFDRLVESFAPSIEGVSEVKEAIILQLFSIETKDPSKIESESPPESYSEPINILLIGENELKSEMLKFTAKVSPTSIYISGNKPLSIKPKYKRRLGRDLLEAGVLILSDGSILCVDNINSIRSVKEDIKIAMESQIINISIKSNGDSVSRSMPTQTSVLASISPKRKLNQRTPVSDQINMKPDLFAEFDLVFVANTKEHFNNVNIENISSYEAESDENSEKIQLDESLIRRYISYANNVNPRLNDENVRNCLHSFFMDLRKDFGPYLINQRKFTSLIELAKASARIHLRDEIEIEDAETAIRVYKNSLKSRGIDLDIDQPNINMILSREEIIKNQKLIDHIVNDIIERKEEVSLNRLIEDMIQKSELTEKMIRILIAGKYL